MSSIVPDISSLLIASMQEIYDFVLRDYYEISSLQGTFSNGLAYADLTEKKIIKRLTESLSQHDEIRNRRLELIGIDGISNFMRSVPFFSTLISVYEGKNIISTVIMMPVLKEIFWAEPGRGAYVESVTGHTFKLRVSQIKSSQDALILSRVPVKNFSKYRNLGCDSASLAYIASGRFDLFFTHKLTWNRVLESGRLLIQEAQGATFVDDKNGIAFSNNYMRHLIRD